MIRILCLNPTIDRMYYIDGFNAGKQYHGNSPCTYPSGKGLNIARVLSYFNVKAIVYAFVGGLTGKKIEDEVLRLGHEGVFFHHQGETRSTINIMDLKNRTETEITESGEIITKEQESEFLLKLESDLLQGDVVICSGLPANGMDFNIYKRVSIICKDKGANCILDANREYLLNSFPAKYSFVKPNEYELMSLFNIKKEINNSEIIFYGKKLITMGVDTVLVSMGKKGAIAITKDNAYLLTVPDVNIVSTIGSGDSTVAGFCYAIINNKNLIDALKMSMAFGVINAMHEEVGYVSPAEVDTIINSITIKEIQ